MEEVALITDLLQLIKGYYDELDTINRDRTTVGLQPTGIRERIHVWKPEFYSNVSPEELDFTINRLRQHLDKTRSTVHSARQELQIHLPLKETTSAPTTTTSGASNGHLWLFAIGALVFLLRK